MAEKRKAKKGPATSEGSRISKVKLERGVQAYYDHGGNISEAARSLGMSKSTLRGWLKAAETHHGVVLGKVADGDRERRIGVTPLALPKKGKKKAYLLTSMQNNTYLHPGFHNLVALAEWYGSQAGYESCTLMVGTFTYQKAAYGRKAVKLGTFDKGEKYEELWYPPEAEAFISDKPVELAPGLIWGGNWNILPTNRHPLTGLEALNGRASNIIPHSKMAMESVASMRDEATKFNYSTGTISLKNYIQKRQGILAEQEHDFGAALVEVDHLGNWWVRHVEIDADDAIMDIGPKGCKGIRVQAGEVTVQNVVEGITWFDIHTAEMEHWVRNACWGQGGVLDTLHPKYQFMHDIFSMRSRGHHEEKDFHRTYQKTIHGENTVDDELQVTADFLMDASRPWVDTVIVPSNHDRHLDRWLNEADFRKDPANAKLFFWLNYHVLDAMDRGDDDFNVLEFALKERQALGATSTRTTFLGLDQSFVIARSSISEGVECGLHGDLGPNGSRGSNVSLSKLGRSVNKGHDHTAARRGKVMSAGASSLRFPYMKGPHTHSVSFIATYANGARSIVTMWDGKFRA